MTLDAGDTYPETARASPPAVDLVLVTRTRDLGGFEVRRALPSSRRRMVGPFIFLDQMGPAILGRGHGLDVRPHPHIGLATLTYLFEGEILHRDSLGHVQPIRPGEANWMVAGGGIAHSERTPPSVRASGGRLFGVQCWLALPKKDEEREPSFVHHDAIDLPVVEADGIRARVIAGEVFGARATARTTSPMFYADVQAAPGARFVVPLDHEERAAYVLEGAVRVDGEPYGPGHLIVLKPRAHTIVDAAAPSRLLLLGGEPMDGPRHIWWNFVSSSRDRIEQAKADWRAQKFAPVVDDDDHVPLPDDPPPPVRYP